MAHEILTISGIRFNPFQARYSDIQIVDIAHALSLMTRANGHIRTFYSIAQHSINCCLEPGPENIPGESSWLACSMMPARVICQT
ncbi:MAG: hypothetical protein LRY35_01450 [Clostridiales bacterium]|nr:hypothetical protein [Clostridiales bacterium]